jgi:hypothetical protein
MSILTRTRKAATRPNRVAPVKSPFGLGILPVESAKDRHQREEMEVGSAVFEGRATRLPIDSPNYRSFVRAMNEGTPCTPRGFTTHSGSYIPSDDESVWATLDAERQENERQEARWETMAQESFEVNRLSGHLTDEDILIATGCVG